MIVCRRARVGGVGIAAREEISDAFSQNGPEPANVYIIYIYPAQ
jgi:hypothetical protein